MRKYFKIKEKRYIVFVLLIIAAEVAASLMPPQVLRLIIDRYLMPGDYRGLPVMAALYFLCFLFAGLADVLSALVLTTVGQKLIRRIRSAMQRKLDRLPAGYFTARSSGSTVSRFMVDVDNINTLFTDGIVSMAIDSFTIIGIIISIWIFSWQLGLFALCLVPVIYFITRAFQKRMLKSQTANLTELSRVNSHISESIRNMTMIKTFSREGYMKAGYKKCLQDNYRTMDKVNFYDSCYSPVIQLLTACAIGFIFFMSSGGSASVLGISIGEIAASVNLMTSLFSPVDSLGMEFQSIQTGISGIKSVVEFMELPEEEPKREYPELDTRDVSFEYRDVTFGYEEGRPVIAGFSAVINKGENVVFTGRTGAGKTTLMKLTSGLLHPDSGQVLVNGIDIGGVASTQKRRLMGYVEQSFSFVNGTVFDQISLDDTSVTRPMVWSAVEFVGLGDYVKGLPEGIDTQASPELFSQGQRQLLAIARAIVIDPPVLLLDEVTANLDSVTEERVVDVLKRAEEGRTIISIAHRQSTINSADRKIEL